MSFKKGVIFAFILMVLIGWGGYWYFTPRVINHTFSLINKELPTTIVAVNSKSNKISDYTLEQLKKLNRKEQNIVYSTNTMLSKFELNKLKPYVDHVKAMQSADNYFVLYKEGERWLFVNTINKKITLVAIDDKTNNIFISKENISLIKKNLPQNPKRYVVFAGYNKDGVIEPYIITYLKGLEEVTDGIVYVADSPLMEGELEKLKGLNLLYVKHEKHGRYDFGSYAIGYNWLKDNGYLDKADELIFANDSVYAPMTSFKPMFDEMDKRRDIDFWGTLEGRLYSNHICSYFLVYKSHVFNTPLFAEIFNSIPPLLDRDGSIFEYETKITTYLEALGYKWSTYISLRDLAYLPEDAKDKHPLSLISKHKSQFFKRKAFNDKDDSKEDIFELLDYLKQNHPKTYSDVISANHKLLQNIKNKED